MMVEWTRCCRRGHLRKAEPPWPSRGSSCVDLNLKGLLPGAAIGKASSGGFKAEPSASGSSSGGKASLPCDPLELDLSDTVSTCYTCDRMRRPKVQLSDLDFDFEQLKDKDYLFVVLSKVQRGGLDASARVIKERQ